jgi:hypothetical protein
MAQPTGGGGVIAVAQRVIASRDGGAGWAKLGGLGNDSTEVSR